VKLKVEDPSRDFLNLTKSLMKVKTIWFQKDIHRKGKDQELEEKVCRVFQAINHLRKFKNLRNLTAENHCHLNRVETHLI
jgi:predicted CoA-binding protein